MYYLNRALAEAKLCELNESLLDAVEDDKFFLEERVLGDTLVQNRPPRFSGEPRRRRRDRHHDEEETE